MSFDIKFEEIFKIPMTCLRFNRCHPSISRYRIGRLQYYFSTTIPLTCGLLLFNSIFVHDISDGRFADATKNGAMLIVSITIILKSMLVLHNRDDIQELITTIDKDYNLARDFSDEQKDIVTRYANMGVQVAKFCLVSTSAVCIMIPMQAVIRMIYLYFRGEFQLVLDYDMNHPKIIEEHKFDLWLYCILFMLYLCFDIFAGFSTVGFDPLVPIFMLHTCGQLELLNHKISKLFIDNQDPKEIEEKLKKIIQKQQHLYRFMDSVKDKFLIFYDVIMKTTTLLLPLSLFRIVEDLRNKYVNPEFILLFFPSLLQFFMPCYYSDLLIETSEKFRYAIYSSGWETCPNTSIRKTILFMLTRAKTPMAIKSVFYIMNLDTFAEMCRQCYAIFNLMNTVFS